MCPVVHRIGHSIGIVPIPKKGLEDWVHRIHRCAPDATLNKPPREGYSVYVEVYNETNMSTGTPDTAPDKILREVANTMPFQKKDFWRFSEYWSFIKFCSSSTLLETRNWLWYQDKAYKFSEIMQIDISIFYDSKTPMQKDLKSQTNKTWERSLKFNSKRNPLYNYF